MTDFTQLPVEFAEMVVDFEAEVFSSLIEPAADFFQCVLIFPNGYGLSMVKSPWHYGGKQGLWEALVIARGEASTAPGWDAVGYIEATEGMGLDDSTIGWNTVPMLVELAGKIHAMPVRCWTGSTD